ncbi:unnamed protein product [Spodoptera littoralis]|uniref:Lipase domain-containing protein n=1 Tax=Spodoptera littoralis TaxID=7109 RepID=A0A9P0IFE1_SPOLI|nr:unnamed protein product [Spodoptera littoralis]
MFSFNFRSFNNSIEVSWTNATQLIDEGYVNLDVTTVFWAFGFRGSETTQGTKEFVETTLSNSNWSVVVVNWPTEAGNVLIPNYVSAAQNTQTIGTELGQAISTMVASGLKPSNVILVGFSLGAQMCGRAGFVIQNIIGQPLPLIVGLDAAKPLFEPIQIFRCIKSTDASSVILVHSDMSLFGVSGSYGTQNFFANDPYYTSHGYQPGCSLANTLLNPIFLFENFNFFRIVFCSHLRSVEFWIENIINNCTIIGNQASSGAAWLLSGGTPNNLTCLGYNASQSAKGNYYFRTNAEPLYGLGINGTTPV